SKQGLERRQEIASLRVDPDGAVAAEHRDRIGLICERARIARNRVAIEAHEAHRVRIVADAVANDRLHTFVGEPLVKPVNQVEANLFRQTLNEAVSGGAAHYAHGGSPPRLDLSCPRKRASSKLRRDSRFPLS